MVYLILKSGIIDKEAIAATIKGWLRPLPLRGSAPARSMIGPPAPPPNKAFAASRNTQTTSPANNPYSSHQMLTRGDLYLSPKISLRQIGRSGQEQTHSFILDDYDVLVVKQAGLHHKWIRLKMGWSQSTAQLQAVPAGYSASPANQTHWGRLQLAMASGIRQLPGQVISSVQELIASLMTWQGFLLIVAVTAIFVLGGEIALVLMGAYAVYHLLMDVLPLLVQFYNAAINATTTKQIDDAGAIFAKALLLGALDVIAIVFAPGAYAKLLRAGGGTITFGGVISYLAERVMALMSRLRKGTGTLNRLKEQAAEWANKIKRLPLKGLSTFDDFKASVTEFADPANQQLAKQAYDLYKAGKWPELESLFTKNKLNGGWPPNRGFIDINSTTLKPGQTFDRYGGWIKDGVFNDKGTFVSPVKEPFPNRALTDATRDKPYRAYEVVKPIPVKSGKIIPWFGKPGKGTQYELPESIGDLLKGGYIKPKK